MGKNRDVLILVEAAIFAAAAMALSMIPLDIGTVLWVSLGTIPLTIISIKRGLKVGLIAGFIWGLLHFVMGKVYYLGAVQAIVEYLVSFTFAGFAGLLMMKFQADKQDRIKTIVVACFVGTFARFFWNFIAGVIYWGSYAPEGWSPLVYSLAVNGGSALVTSILCSIALVIIYRAVPKIFEVESEQVI